MAAMISVGIVGATGYVAGELIRIAVQHPEMEIDFLYSHSKPGVAVSSVHGDLFTSDLVFTDRVNPEVDVLFLCTGHGKSAEFLNKYAISDSTVIIDLSNDFRLSADANFGGRKFVYGLIDSFRNEVAHAKSVANPGCFATAIQSAILPIAAAGKLKGDLHVNAITGSTGAGGGFSETTHFSQRVSNVSLYKSFTHQHLGEIGESIAKLQPEWDGKVNFLPVRGNFSRGIFSSVYTKTDEDVATWTERFESYYAGSPFVSVTNAPIHLKQVVNTNHVLLQVEVIDGKLLVTSVIDNLLKGAAGQAIENMNTIFDLAPETGLNFKPNFF